MTHPTDAQPGGLGEAPSSGFRQDVEGLRAIAVLGVVLFHASTPGLGGGFVGVDVFFVISGYLITGLLWREVRGTGTIGFGRFYGARARRLLPASAAVGVVTLIGAAVLLPPLQARTVIGDGIASALYVSNFRFLQQNTDYFFGETAPSPFQHYWSLGVEEQFYLVWPGVIIATVWFLRRRARRSGGGAAVGSSALPYLVVLALIAASSFALSLVTTHLVPLAAFFLSPARAWELALGGLVALSSDRWRRLPPRAGAATGWLGLAMILLACNRLQSTTPYPGTAALLPVLGTALVIGAGCAAPSSGAGRVLSLPPMRAIGRISYSWYLWHWPVLILAPPLLGHQLGWAGRSAAVAISAALAVLTLRFVENPFRFSSALRTSARRSLSLGAAATAIAVGVGAALLALVAPPVGRGPAAPALALTGLPGGAAGSGDAADAAITSGFAQVQSALAASAGMRPGVAVPANLQPPIADAAAENQAMRTTACLRQYLEVSQPACVTGDPTSSTTIALVGDSNAAMWNPAFKEVAAQRKWRLETLVKAACPLLDLPIASRDLRRTYTECEKWRSGIFARLESERPQLIVVSMWRLYGHLVGGQPFDAAWADSLTRMVQRMRATGARVLVMGPIPDPHASVPVCLSEHLDDVAACTVARSEAVDASGIAVEVAAAEAGGARYADVTDLFCTPDRCPPVIGNTLMYLDESHITSEYAHLLSPILGAMADRSLALG